MGKAEDRAARYGNSNPPLGCMGGMSDCAFNGTKENFESERVIWIQNCADQTRGGFLGPSDKTRTNACQNIFDSATVNVRYGMYSDAVEEKGQVLANISSNSPAVYLIGFAFAGLIIYLLLSD